MLRKSIVLTAVLTAGLMAGPRAALAHYGHEQGGQGHGHLQLIRNASQELKSSNPALAQRLSECADRKEREHAEMHKMREEHEQAEAADVQLFRESATALKQSNPKLSKKLVTFANDEEGEHERGERREHKEEREEHRESTKQNFKP